MELTITRKTTITDTRLIGPSGSKADPPLVKVAAVVIVKNPFVGRYVEDLGPLIEASVPIGEMMGRMAMDALRPHTVQSYGKAGIVGIGGEQEHANALLTSDFFNPIRKVIGGGKAWVSSMTKVAAPGALIDVPMNHRDAVYVRSHYDGMSITLGDGPAPDEIALIVCFGSRGRLDARVGGLQSAEVKGLDGLV